MDRLIKILVLILLTLSAEFVTAQSDTVAYKVGKYDIKKQEKVFVVAARLMVDPNIIVKLNKLRNTQQDLVPGQRIKIPIYPKGYVYEPEKVVIHKTIETDSAQLSLLNELEAKEPETVKPALPNISLDEATNRLMMVDALLELNEAMLQGVKASIDTLNKSENNEALDEKNIQAMLLRMKRSRDKVLLMPYLQKLNDSLSTEINILKEEKTKLQNYLSPPVPEVIKESIVKTDTLIAGADTIVYKTTTTSDGISTSEVADVMVNETDIIRDDTKRIEVIRSEKRNKKFKQYYPVDTIIIYDLGTIKPEPEKKKIEQPQTSGIKLWDTARAVNPVIDTATIAAVKQLKDTVIQLKIKIPNTLDSVIIKSIRPVAESKTSTLKDSATNPLTQTTSSVAVNKPEKQEQKEGVERKNNVNPLTQTVSVVPSKPDNRVNVATVNDSLNPLTQTVSVINYTEIKDTLNTSEVFVSKVDTITNPVKSSIEKTETVSQKQSVGEMAMASGDSVRKIKAVFFFKRAQKALSEKNFRNAEQYLEKSIELSPRYYDAWFALAELNSLFGSASTALKQYETCMSIDSSQSKLHQKMGELYMKIKRRGDALNAFTRAIDLNPSDISSLMQRAAIESDFKQYDLAIRDYNLVLKTNRSYHYAYKSRGQVYVLNRNYAAAIDDFTRFLIFETTDPSAYYYRGLAKIANNELLDGCLDLSTASEMGYTAATKAIKKSCE